MLDKINAPGGRGKPSGARFEGGLQNNYTTSHTTCQLLEYLATGRENANTAAELAAWLNMKPRDLTRLVERARLQGAPICATCNAERPGYYIAADADELSEYLRRFKRRQRTIAQTEAALMTTLCAMTGQQVMDLKGGGD